MKKQLMYFGLVLVALVFSGCAAFSPPPLDKQNMVPKSSELVLKPTGKSIALGTFEGPRGKGQNIYLITVHDLKSIIAEGLKNSQLCSAVASEAQTNLDYTLTAKIKGQPGSGIVTVTVEFLVDYELKRNSTGETVFSQRITGKQSVSTGEAFVGVTRARLAVEGAARDNVKQLLENLSKLQL